MKKKLREILQPEIQILSEQKTKDGSLKILAPWIQADRKNNNGRLYPLSLLQREVAETQKRIEQGSAIGSADHPGGAFTTLGDASHIITKLEVDKNGKGWMEAKILPTSKGKNVIEIIKAGGQLGISARGAGSISKDGRVESDYKLLGIDIVTNPSEPTATFDQSNVFESLEFSDESKSKNKDKNKELEKAINKLEQESYLSALDSGFKGDQKDWLKNCGSLREAMGLKEDDEDERVEKLTEEQINKRIRGYYREAVSAGFKGDFNAWKKQYPRIVEMAKQPIKIVEKKEVKRPFNGKMTLSEARGAGFKGTAQQFKEKYPEMELVLPAPPQKIKKVVERELTEKEITEEAGRIFTALSKDNPDNKIMLEDVKKILMEEEEEKVDKRIRKKAIMIVSQEADGSVSQEKLKEMVEIEVKNLQAERKKRLSANWKCYRRLLG